MSGASTVKLENKVDQPTWWDIFQFDFTPSSGPQYNIVMSIKKRCIQMLFGFKIYDLEPSQMAPESHTGRVCPQIGTSDSLLPKFRERNIVTRFMILFESPKALGVDKKFRRLLLVLLYTWLFLNSDPAYARRTIASMVASRMLNQSIKKLTDDAIPSTSKSSGGLNTAEAIALIQAINNNNNNNNNHALQTYEALQPPTQQRQSTLRQSLQNRQLPVPVPLPVPAPVPAPFPVPVPFAVLVAAVAAFLAAVGSGLAPFPAIVVAAIVALAALFLAILALLIPIVTVPQPSLIKKLIIKKTVYPFVIPIPIKKKEKEVIYKPIYVHKEHHKEHHSEHHDMHYKKYKGHKGYKHKSDESSNRYVKVKQDHHPLMKIEDLIEEQDHLQNLVEKFVPEKENIPKEDNRRIGKNEKF